MPDLNRHRWLSAFSLGVTLIGLGVSLYLTVAHYTDKVSLSCPDTGIINCLKVTTSSYATIGGIPLALAGVVYFLIMVFFCLPAAWQSPLPWVGRSRLVLSLLGVMVVIWLLYVELFRLNALCLYCTVIHLTTLALFVVVMLSRAWQDEY